ncbi:N-acylphosphatidylethanolamine synthase isoform X2 [Elaeis guineensis]|uniref:N-acylphosphatidylethanolamine synthase isoform X2 n=1 Tax=Elaeis guineensis var. tenera TaxID=51953 RepID=UPI003C6CCB05
MRDEKRVDEVGGESGPRGRAPSGTRLLGRGGLRQGRRDPFQLKLRSQPRNPNPPCPFPPPRPAPHHRQQSHVHEHLGGSKVAISCSEKASDETKLDFSNNLTVNIGIRDGVWLEYLGPDVFDLHQTVWHIGLDDPLMWGFKGFPTADAKLARWVLAAEDICFKNVILSYIFRLGKCIPITRGGGIYQAHMNEALEVLSGGGWLHTFPEGKVSQESAPIRRLKWGTASLIVMPEKYFFGRRPPVPLWNKDIKIVIGEPIEFDLQRLKQTAKTVSRDSSIHSLGWPSTTDGLDEAAQKWLYIYISDQIRTILERLRIFGATFKRFKESTMARRSHPTTSKKKKRVLLEWHSSASPKGTAAIHCFGAIHGTCS